MKNMKPAKAAAREAYEEAGIRGTIARKPVGSFLYDKCLDDENGFVPCRVRVFPLLVKHQLDTWPEQLERDIRWLDPEAAASMVQEDGLRRIIASFASNQHS